MNDTEFRRSVERDARAVGMPPDVAAALARHVGKPLPAGIEPPTHRASAVRYAQSPRNDGLDRLCRLYECPPGLVAELKRSGAALRTLADVLARANDGGKVNRPAIVERVRLMLATHAMRGAA